MLVTRRMHVHFQNQVLAYFGGADFLTGFRDYFHHAGGRWTGIRDRARRSQHRDVETDGDVLLAR